MSAAPRPGDVRVLPMTVGQVGEVAALEARAYAFPWSRGNFIDSLAAGYFAEVLLDAEGRLLAYQVAMAGVDELHLLNITVSPSHWGQGLARLLLDRLVHHARTLQMRTVWLEVRESNERARRIYERYGFVPTRVRRAYYPAPQGQREDAVEMSLRVLPAQEVG